MQAPSNHCRRSPAFRLRCLLAAGGLVLRAFAAPAAEAPKADSAPRPELGPPPGWVIARPWTVPEKLQENPGGEDFLLVDEQSRLATNEDYHHRVFQIVSDGGRQDSAQVTFHFDPSYQKLTIHQLNLVRGREVSDRLKPDQIQVIQQERDLDSQLYNGERSALVILDDVRVGDIIDLAYTLQGANPVFNGRFIDTATLDWSVPVRELHYRLLVPPGRTILSRVQGSSQASFSSRVRDGEQELDWVRTDAPVVESEDKVPSSHVLFSFLDLSEFSTWTDVVQWALPLYAVDDAPRPLLDATVAEIRQQAATPEQQAVAALALVQQQIRYLGIEMGPGSHRPSEPEEVLRRRFGDCKDKARLLTALLRRLGLSAAPALVHSARREAVRDRLPTPYAFDHVVVALDLAGRRYILDATLAYQRGERLALRHTGRYGPYLRIDQGTTGLENAELGLFDTSRSLFKEEFQVAAMDQPASFTVTTVAEGRAADNLRVHFATHTLDQIGREYLDYYTHYYPGIIQLKPIETADDSRENRYTTTEHYQVKRLFTPNDDGKKLRAEFQPASIWDYAHTPNLAQRTQPYALSHPTQVEEQITVHLPEDWKVTPNDEKVTDAGFTVEARAKSLGSRTVFMEYLWQSHADRVEPARLAEFATHAEQARKALGYELTWRTAKAETPEPKAPVAAVPAEKRFFPNWPMVALAAGVIVAGAYGTWRLARKRNPTPPEPPLIVPVAPVGHIGTEPAGSTANLQGLGGWLWLVIAGMLLRPYQVVTTIYGARRAYFSGTTWQLLVDPSSPSYSANYALVAPLELIVNFTQLVVCVLLPLLFFRRSHLFPRVIQAFLIFNVGAAVFSILDNAMLSHAPDTETSLATLTYLGQTLVAAAIWIPYFQVSRRVQATFTR